MKQTNKSSSPQIQREWESTVAAPPTLKELIAMLEQLQPDRVLLVGYIDDKGDIQQLKLKDIQAQTLSDQRKELIEECFGLFNEILDEAQGNKESSNTPDDPKIRIAWLKPELDYYKKRMLSTLQQKETK